MRLCSKVVQGGGDGMQTGAKMSAEIQVAMRDVRGVWICNWCCVRTHLFEHGGCSCFGSGLFSRAVSVGSFLKTTGLEDRQNDVVSCRKDDHAPTQVVKFIGLKCRVQLQIASLRLPNQLKLPNSDKPQTPGALCSRSRRMLP